MTSGISILVSALAYAQRGFAVIPVRPRGKAPHTAHGYKDGSRDPDQIRRWWQAYPSANIGIVTGQPSSLVVVDIDRKPQGPDGEASWCEWAEKAGPLPPTCEVETGGGGRHLYYRRPTSLMLASAVGVLPGVDIRAEGGYVVAPPSLHASGRPYEWKISRHPDDVPLAEVPDCLLRLLRGRADSIGPASSLIAGAPSGRILEGLRNDGLARLAGTMRRPGMTEDAIVAALLVENQLRCTPPLGESEVRRIAHSVMRYQPARRSNGADAKTSEVTANKLRMTTLADIEEAKPKWLWPGRIPLGCISILEGPPGVGKTTLALAISAAVTRGRSLPGNQESRHPADVLVFSAEDSAATTLRPRSRAQDADLARLHVMACVDGHDLPMLPNDLPRLESLIAEHRAELVILDPLMAFLPPKEINAYRDQDVRRAMAPLAAMADRMGCAVLLIRHLTKDGSRSAIYRGGGSVGIIAAARSALVVMKDEQDPTAFVLANVKNNLSRTAPSLRYRHEPVVGQEQSRLVWYGEANVDAEHLGDDGGERSAIEEAIAFLLVELSDGARSGKDVQLQAQEAGISVATLRRARQILGVKAWKQRFDRGRWMWELPEGAQNRRVSAFGPKNSASEA